MEALTAPVDPAVTGNDVSTMEQHAAEAAKLLAALANPHRLMILCALGQSELSVGELNAHVPLSQSALSQHLAVLRDQAIVSCRRQAQSILYRVTPGPAVALVSVLHRHFCGSVAPDSEGTLP